MQGVEVNLLYNSPISLAVYAARTCTNTVDKMKSTLGEDFLHEDDARILKERILTEDMMNPAHESVIEHAVYTFEIAEVSRLLLQELMRHRIASPSVQSTRFALKKLLNAFIKMAVISKEDLDKLLVLTGDDDVDELSRKALLNLIELASKRRIPNDRLKFPLPEAFKTRLVLTINARSLRNLFVLRTSKKAMWEIRRLAFAMLDAIPESHKVLFEDKIHPRPKRFRTWLGD